MKNDFTSNQLKKFLTLPGEELIVARRQHPLLLILALLTTLGVALVLIIIVSLLFNFFGVPPFLHWSLGLFSYALLVSALSKQTIDWHYHFYVITTRRIVEIIATPFFYDVINDIFLDQVRTTEVDVKIPNFIFELLNIGDVVISFDRPSHDAIFVLKSISDPYSVGMCLGDTLEEMMKSTSVWFKRGEMPEHIKFTEDSFEGRRPQI